MSNLPYFDYSSYLIVKTHNDVLSSGVRDSIAKLRSIPRSQRPPYVNGQIAYFIHVLKALKWSTAIAAQKAKVDLNARSAAK